MACSPDAHARSPSQLHLGMSSRRGADRWRLERASWSADLALSAPRARHTLVLVDTGYGLRDVHDPASRLSRFFLTVNGPELRESMTAPRQIEALGFDARDVRQIVLSHLDFDHAGGLDDFPHATVHLLGEEIAAATAQKTMLDRMRYRPQQWSETRGAWQAHSSGDGEPWFGFECVRDLPGVGPEVLMVPLIGHTLGHAGVAVRRDAGWLFYAADAYFYHAEMDLRKPRCTPGLRAYQRLIKRIALSVCRTNDACVNFGGAWANRSRSSAHTISVSSSV